MYNDDTELLFPPRVIPALLDLRGESWNELVSKTIQQQPTEMDRLAFVLLMIRLGGCTSCSSDSFRAMRGCTQCARQTIRRFRGSDQELIRQFDKARKDIDRYLKTLG